MRIHKNIPVIIPEEPEKIRNTELKIGECLTAPDGSPALEILIHTSDDTWKKLFIMQDNGFSFKVCNVSGMGSYASTSPIGNDFLKSMCFSMMSELVLKLMNIFEIEHVEFERGYSSSYPIEQFLSSCIGEDR